MPVLLAALFVGGAVPAAYQMIRHGTASTDAIEKILLHYNMKNEGEEAVYRYGKEHPVLGFFMEEPVRHEMNLPSHEQAAESLGPELRHLLKTVREEARIAAWWSWFFLSLSLVYAAVVIAIERSFFTRPVFFAFTCISLICFIVGVLAPAMVIWTAPTLPMESGPVSFVLQHQVRGIWAIIHELLTTGHQVIGAFLLLFSIITPMTKAALTFFITACRSAPLNHKIAHFLHAIGKWSMADVFVAGVLLSLYALKAQEATKSAPCIGLYYFIGYCLLSMTTTELLTHSSIIESGRRLSIRTLGAGVVGGIVVTAFCLVAASSLYTYQQYTENGKHAAAVGDSPQSLNNANLVLPAHK